MTHGEIKSAIAQVLQYSGLSFCNRDHALAMAVINAAGFQDNEATYARVKDSILSGFEKINSVARISGERVSLDRSASILADFAIAA